MNIWLILGFRNIANNKRRSFFTMAAIAFGFTAINTLGGFTGYVFRGLEDSYVYALGNGHLSVFKKGFLREGALNPGKYLLSGAEIQQILSVYDRDKRILLLSPGLNIMGLLNNGESSAIMTAEGRIPSAIEIIRAQGRGKIGKLKMYQGSDLGDDEPEHIGVAKGLAGKLGLQLNSAAMVLAPTVDGYMNALDATVVQHLDAAMELLDEVMMSVPLEFARKLYDTSGGDRMIVLLSATGREQMESIRVEMERELKRTGLDIEIRTWEELRPSYFRVREMFSVIFSFFFSVVTVIVGLSVINTVSTAVVERTREIGTLRALGLKRKGTIVIFGTESALLAVMGCALGVSLTILVWAGVQWSELTWIPPTIPKRVPLEIDLDPVLMVESLGALVMLSSLAAVIPARRAARMAITDALAHV